MIMKAATAKLKIQSRAPIKSFFWLLDELTWKQSKDKHQLVKSDQEQLDYSEWFLFD